MVVTYQYTQTKHTHAHICTYEDKEGTRPRSYAHFDIPIGEEVQAEEGHAEREQHKGTFQCQKVILLSHCC